jgi:hypothetical protein
MRHVFEQLCAEMLGGTDAGMPVGELSGLGAGERCKFGQGLGGDGGMAHSGGGNSSPEGGQEVFLPVSEVGARQVQKVIGEFNRSRDFLFVEDRPVAKATLQ